MQPHNPSPVSGRKIRRSALLLVIALALGFLVVAFIKAHHESRLAKDTKAENATPLMVDVTTVRKSPATLPLKLPGETAPWYESIIYTRVDGYVGKWYADIGDHVKKGQVLATIETPDLDAQLNASEAKLKAGEALVKAREAEANFAKTTYARWKDAPKGVVSEQEREAKKAGYNSAVAELNEAKAQVALDEADVNRYTVLTQFKKVTAPYDGRITERRIDIGNLVTAGSSSNTPLYHLSKNHPIRIFVDVPQNASSSMKAGVAADITVGALPDRVFEGKIARTAEAINPQTRTLRVEVDIANDDRALEPGMYVDAAFQLPSVGLLQVPAAAILFHAEGPEIAVVDNSSRVHFHKAVIARDDGNIVELSAGAQEGDKVALNISNQITEGEKVTISEPKEETNHASAQQ